MSDIQVANEVPNLGKWLFVRQGNYGICNFLVRDSL